MPNLFSQTLRTMSSRAKLGICFSLALCALTPPFTYAQANRPKIVGIARVRIEGGSIPTDNADKPVRFYSAFRLGTLGSFQSGATVFLMYALNEHQELDLQAGPRLDLPPGTPPRNDVSLVLFETPNVVALHDYLKSKQVNVNDVAANSVQVKDADGKSVTGDPLLFTMKDPDGHLIGFLQYKSPLKFRKEEVQVSSRIIHAGFIVHDRPAMEHFYKDILGFRPYWHGGMKDDREDWVSLQVPDGSDWIEFMLNVPDNADKHLRGVMNHIALGVTDIQAAKAQLIKNGLALTEQPKLGRDGKWQLNLYDPDDTRVELMEFTPVEKPCCSEYTGPHPKP